MTTIRERRLTTARAQLNRAIEQREDAIGKLVKLEVKIKGLRRQVQRYERLAALSKAEPKATAAPEPVKPLPAALAAEYRATADGDDGGIPGFLQRKKRADARDAELRQAIIAENAERKRLKSRGRIERMKAKQSGETAKMPLSGKAALEAIRRG